MPNQVITEGWGPMLPVLTEPHAQRKPEQGLQAFPLPLPTSTLHPIPLPFPHPRAWGVVLGPFDDGTGTHQWKRRGGANGIIVMRFLINLITMSRVYLYPSCLGQAEVDSVPVCSSRRCMSYSTAPTVLSTIFFSNIVKKCGSVEGALRVALTCSMQMTFGKPLTSLGLSFPEFKMRG